jgi:hypothetical protein
VPSARLQMDLVSQSTRLILPKLTPHLRAYGGSVAPDQSFCASEMTWRGSRPTHSPSGANDHQQMLAALPRETPGRWAQLTVLYFELRELHSLTPITTLRVGLHAPPADCLLVGATSLGGGSAGNSLGPRPLGGGTRSASGRPVSAVGRPARLAACASFPVRPGRLVWWVLRSGRPGCQLSTPTRPTWRRWHRHGCRSRIVVRLAAGWSLPAWCRRDGRGSAEACCAAG